MTTKIRKRRALALLAAGVLATAGASYLAGHTHGEVDPRGPGYAWLAVDVGPGQVTAYAGAGPGLLAGLRYDHTDTSVTDVVSVAAYAGQNVGVVAASMGGHCLGYEVWPLPGGVFTGCDN